MLFSEIKKDIVNFLSAVKEMDRKPVIIFISIAILQTVSWYYTSRSFFVNNFRDQFIHLDSATLLLVEFFYWFVGDFISLFLLPVVIILFVFKEKLNAFGVTLGEIKIGLTYSAIAVLVMFPILWYVTTFPGFILFYPHYSASKDSYQLFLLYEAGILFYLFAWEFIWRGYMLFGLYPKFGYYAVLIQMIPFLILHNGKPPAETFAAIAGGIALGVIALRSRSFLYGVLIHFLVMAGIDLLSVLRYKTGDYGLSPASFVNLISDLLKGLL